MLCVYSLKIASQCCRKLLILNELAENSSALSGLSPVGLFFLSARGAQMVHCTWSIVNVLSAREAIFCKLKICNFMSLLK